MYGLGTALALLSCVMPSIARILELYSRKWADADEANTCAHPPVVNTKLQEPWRCYPLQTRGRLKVGSKCISDCLYGAMPVENTGKSIDCYRRTWLADAKPVWRSDPLRCITQECDTSEINPVENGLWRPEKCMLQHKVKLNTYCTLECNSLYRRTASRYAVCQKEGWSHRLSSFKCQPQSGVRHHNRSEPTDRPTLLEPAKVEVEATTPAAEQLEEFMKVTEPEDIDRPQSEENQRRIEQLKQIAAQEEEKRRTQEAERLEEKLEIEEYEKRKDGNMEGAEEVKEKLKEGGEEMLEGIRKVVKYSSTNIIVIVSVAFGVVTVIIIIAVVYFNKRPAHRYALINQDGEQLLPLNDENNNAVNNNNNTSQVQHVCGDQQQTTPGLSCQESVHYHEAKQCCKDPESFPSDGDRQKYSIRRTYYNKHGEANNRHRYSPSDFSDDEKKNRHGQRREYHSKRQDNRHRDSYSRVPVEISEPELSYGREQRRDEYRTSYGRQRQGDGRHSRTANTTAYQRRESYSSDEGRCQRQHRRRANYYETYCYNNKHRDSHSRNREPNQYMESDSSDGHDNRQVNHSNRHRNSHRTDRRAYQNMETDFSDIGNQQNHRHRSSYHRNR